MSKRLISLFIAIVMIFAIIPPASYTALAADFETQLRDAGFSSSYIAPLLALHAKYPNWKFETLMVGEDFSTAVANERKHGTVSPGHNQQLIQQYSANDGKGYYCTCASCYKDGKPVVREGSNWVAASQSAVEYYLDPRNFLDEKYIFQFVSTEYNPPYTTDGIETILKGTWMYNANITYKDKNGNTVTYKNSSGSTVKYSKAIMDAAKDFKISAYYIAAKIVQEVGGATATAGGASGTYSGYPGIYNYYNINATSGAKDGLKWASTKPVEKCETNTDCRLRPEPNTKKTELVILPKGTKLTYKSTTQSDHYKWINVSVTYNGKSYTGYIREDLVNHVTNDYNRPWTNPYLSIYNGAKWIANNYGSQFTGYLQKFNVNPASSNMHDHEYMANVQGAASEGSKAYTAYKNANLLNSEITFTIPVFNNMPNDYPDGITANASNAGIEISWNQVPGAPMYRVFYKANGESTWHKIADTANSSYVWTGAKAGTKYAFTVGCLSGEGGSLVSNYDKTGAIITYTAKPAISSVSNEATGVKISWGKVTGAEKYRVYYKTGSGGWTKIADTTSTSYTWTGAKSNTTYSFTVRCMTSDGKAYASGYDTAGKSIAYIAAPKLASISASGNGVSVSWNAVSGAEKYRVFRKTGSGSWVRIATTTSTSYTDKTASIGTKYTYTVRCIDKNGSYISGYDGNGISITPTADPALPTLSKVATGIQISWSKVSGAEKYRIFYKANDESTWHKAGDSAATSYIWTGAKSNTKYTFTVRCITSDGSNYASGYNTTGKSINYIAAPKISSVTNDTTGVTIKWGSVAGAAKYRVFYKANGESTWHNAGDTASTSLTWTKAKSGTNYSFTVRCLDKDGNYTSSYDNAGKSTTFIAAPSVSSVSNAANGVTVKWSKPTGATKYRVFYKAAGESTWHKAGDTPSASYTWTKAKSGTKYTFTVRCIDSNGNYVSGYDNNGKSITYVAAPIISSVSNATNGVTVKWGKVTGASNYRVFYKANGESTWHKAGDTASTSYTWTKAVSGTKYTFTIRCLDKNGNYISNYDLPGKSITYIAAPKLSSVSKTSSGIQVKWGKVTGAAKYTVFYKASGESTWHKAGDTTSTSYTWTGGKSGTKYSITVRCVSSDGKTYTSGYDATGKSITR